MHEPTAHKIQELIRHYTPTGAAGYFFQRMNRNNEVLRYPPSGSFRLSPFDAPFGVPNGVYTVFFVRLLDDRHPMPARNPENPYPEIPYFFSSALSDAPARTESEAPSALSPGAPRDASAGIHPPPQGPESESVRSLRAELHAELERMPQVRETRIEYLQRRLALALQEQNQDLLKYGHYVTEVGGQFQLNRAYRLESQQAMETVLGLAKRTAEDAQQMMTLFRSIQELQGEALVSIKKQVAILAAPPPPPPAPDYSGAATAAVHLLRDIGVALIQVKGGTGVHPLAASPPPSSPVITADLQPTAAALPIQKAPAEMCPTGTEATAASPASAVSASRAEQGAAAVAAAAAPPSPAGPPFSGQDEKAMEPIEISSDLHAQLSALAAEFQQLESAPCASASGPPAVAVPIVTPPSSPLNQAPVPLVPAPQVQPVLDPSQQGAQRAQAERLLAAVGSIDELQAMVAAGNLSRLQTLLASLREAAQS